MTNFGIAKDMHEYVVRRQIRILENMEKICNWMAEIRRPTSRKDRMAIRYIRGILKRKYKKYKRLGVLNIEGKLGREIERLKDFKYYETKAHREVESVFKDSKFYGARLELEGIFKKYMDVHLCNNYKKFLKSIHKFNVDKSRFRYIEYLNELNEYLSGVIKIKYLGEFRKFIASAPSIIERAEAHSFCEKGCMEGVFPKVYCIACSREISRNVFVHHLKGKKHCKKEKEEILLCSMPVLKAEGLVVKALEILDRERRHSISRFSGREKDVRNDVPKWLYKKRELDILFECDICGYSGYGRISFDRHFGEDIHGRGVSKYGIKYSPVLKGITRVGILMKMKDRMEESESFTEEFEDEDGNVFDKRTYEDLRRNNLI
ncbi:DUF3449 domain-containing protein [Encephalitozoon hellem]|uniref:DUF3449 domain-containing protein n=1 Tax=Encephalitozoon hellem TaxID=27973 RepID=A0ABY8CJH0_ENCHE|nr:DUF3449 domain-containing protein [Encephalitozoon hellem]